MTSLARSVENLQLVADVDARRSSFHGGSGAHVQESVEKRLSFYENPGDSLHFQRDSHKTDHLLNLVFHEMEIINISY